MTSTPVFGEFLGPAGEHITAAVSFRGDLAYEAQCGVVRQIDRLVATLARYLTDLPLPDGLHPSRALERDAAGRAVPTALALDRAAQSLRLAAAGTADPGDGVVHPAVGHLSAAAGYLAAGRDLLHTHFIQDPAGVRAGTSRWAPVITSGPVTAALLSELADYLNRLSPWIAKQSGARRVNLRARTSAQLALRDAEPWLALAGSTLEAAQRAHYPLPARNLLDAIPANAPPPRQLPSGSEPAHELCERIPLTAERLRYAAFTFAPRARWSPAATSASWRRDALASAITSHGSELILRRLTERAGQLGMEPTFRAQLHNTAQAMHRTWRSWRAVTDHWDIMTTGTNRGAGLTPAAAEIGDLVLLTGRLAYRNPHWTPACAHTSQIRDPADLAHSPGDVISALSAVHHAIDTINQIAANDYEAVLDATASNQLFVPTRLLPDTYDIPHPYAPAPRAHTDALLGAYDTAIQATTRTTTALDDLTSAVNAPSSLLAAARHASMTPRQDQRRQHDQRNAPRPHPVTPVPGRTEQALRKLHIRDPALLLRAAVIDQAARDLVTEATAKTHSRNIVTGPGSRSVPRLRQAPGPPARVASQDVPPAPRAGQPVAVMPGVSPGRGSSALQRRIDSRRSADRR
jgi:hypothetical protein